MRAVILLSACAFLAACVSRETRTTERVQTPPPATTTYQTVPAPTTTTTTIVSPTTMATVRVERLQTTPGGIIYRFADTNYLSDVNNVALSYCQGLGRSSARLNSVVWQNNNYVATYQCL